MKALSIRQPWVYHIFHSGKDIENRTWKTSYRGTIIIHAASKPCNGLPVGCLVGTVDIVDCVTQSDSKWFTGPYGLVLANPRLFKAPIPYKGQLKLFDIPESITQNLSYLE